MEVVNGNLNNHSDVILNGYMNKSFQANVKENNMAICELHHCEVSGVSTQLQGENTTRRYEKRPKGTRMWSFVSRRRAGSGRSKRPQSMILTHEVIEPKPKLSFMDKVRSFKRLRSATFSKSSVLRNSKAKVQSQPSEDIELTIPSALFRTRKYADGQRPYRHSYAGYIDDLDTSFEDVELNISISECFSSENKWLRDIDDGINGNSEHMDNEDFDKTRKWPLVSTKSSTIAEGEIQRRGLNMTPDHRRGRSSHMWNYIRGLSKDSAKGFDKFQDSTFQNAEDSKDNIWTAEKDQRLQDNTCVAKTCDSSSGGKSKNFGGVLKFFSNVAVAARKWRGSSRSSTSDDQVSQSTPRTPRMQNSFIKEPLVIENENALNFLSEVQRSPESGMWESHHAMDNAPVQDILPTIKTEEESHTPELYIPHVLDDDISNGNYTCVEEIAVEPTQATSEMEQPDESTRDDVPSVSSDTSYGISQPQNLNKSQMEEPFERNCETAFMTRSSLNDTQDEDVFECSESQLSLSTSASSSEEVILPYLHRI